MRRTSPPLFLAVVLLAVGCGVFGPNKQELWACLNPDSGKLTGAPYDATHYVNGVFDPCHCYDPCGPEASCPIAVDAGPPGPGCDAGDDGAEGAGGGDGGW
jgi:hypothetical protein